MPALRALWDGDDAEQALWRWELGPLAHLSRLWSARLPAIDSTPLDFAPWATQGGAAERRWVPRGLLGIAAGSGSPVLSWMRWAYPAMLLGNGVRLRAPESLKPWLEAGSEGLPVEVSAGEAFCGGLDGLILWERPEAPWARAAEENGLAVWRGSDGCDAALVMADAPLELAVPSLLAEVPGSDLRIWVDESIADAFEAAWRVAAEAAQVATDEVWGECLRRCPSPIDALSGRRVHECSLWVPSVHAGRRVASQGGIDCEVLAINERGLGRLLPSGDRFGDLPFGHWQTVAVGDGALGRVSPEDAAAQARLSVALARGGIAALRGAPKALVAMLRGFGR